MRTWWKALLLLVMLASACSSTEDEAFAPERSPLAAHHGFDETEDFDSAVKVGKAQQVEAEIVACMASQGFEYVPKLVTVESVVGTAVGGELDRLTYARTYGLSVSTIFDEAFLAESPVEEPEVDPNDAIVEALTSGERDAWYAALGGRDLYVDPNTGTAIDPRTGDVIEDIAGDARSGCVGSAMVSIDRRFGVLVDLSPQVEELDRRVDADRRVTDIEADWADCMAARGYAYIDRTAMRAAVAEDFDALRREIIGVLNSPGDAPVEITDAPGALPLPQALRARLDEFQAGEIAIAVASHECDGDIEAVRNEVRAELERSFIAEHEDALAELHAN